MIIFPTTHVTTANIFRRWYRMSQSLLLQIVEAVHNHDLYFYKKKKDGVGRLGLSPLQKITVAFWMLAYRLPADATDEYVKIGESTEHDCGNFFRKISSISQCL